MEGADAAIVGGFEQRCDRGRRIGAAVAIVQHQTPAGDIRPAGVGEHVHRRGRAVELQRAGLHGRDAAVVARAAEGQRAGAGFRQSALAAGHCAVEGERRGGVLHIDGPSACTKRESAARNVRPCAGIQQSAAV